MGNLISIRAIKKSLQANNTTSRDRQHIEAFLSFCDAISGGSQEWGVNPKSLEDFIGKELFDKLFGGGGHAVKEGDTNG